MESVTGRACLADEEKRFADKKLPGVRAPICLAKKVGEGLG
jgi:hypothetical protein